MKMENLARMIDHSLLAPTTTTQQIVSLCEEAVEYGFASVCIPPCHVSSAAKRLYGSDTLVGTVVGFPCGYTTLRQKVQETVDYINAGAGEIDMVVNIGQILENRFDLIHEEIAQVVLAARQVPLKVIIECCFLTDDQKRMAAATVVNAGAAFVKTSTGFGPSGAVVEDVALLAAVVNGRIGVKAAGGIRSLETCLEMLEAGASRIGTSAGVQMMRQWQAQQGV